MAQLDVAVPQKLAYGAGEGPYLLIRQANERHLRFLLLLVHPAAYGLHLCFAPRHLVTNGILIEDPARDSVNQVVDLGLEAAHVAFEAALDPVAGVGIAADAGLDLTHQFHQMGRFQ